MSADFSVADVHRRGQQIFEYSSGPLQLRVFSVVPLLLSIWIIGREWRDIDKLPLPKCESWHLSGRTQLSFTFMRYVQYIFRTEMRHACFGVVRLTKALITS